MNPQNVKLNYSDAKSDKNHKDGGLTINSALLLRDNTLPEDSTTYWQFGPNTRTIGDITDSFFSKDTQSTLPYAIYALQEGTKQPTTLPHPFTHVDIENDKREGTLVFSTDEKKIFMNNGFTMTDRRSNDLRTALEIVDENKWLNMKFGEDYYGGGVKAVIFSSIYESLVNAILLGDNPTVVGMRVSEASDKVLTINDYYEPTKATPNQRSDDISAGSTEGYLGLNRARYVIVKVKDEYIQDLHERVKLPINANTSNNALNTLMEVSVGETAEEYNLDPIQLFDITYGEMGLFDTNGDVRGASQLYDVNVANLNLRGFGNDIPNLGFYVKNRKIT